MSDEIEKIKERYERRKKIPKDFYSVFNPGNLFITQERDRKIIGLLAKYKLSYLADKKILDIGCGTGSWLRSFVQWGAKPENLCGIDLLEDVIREAKQISPNISFICQSAERISFPDKSFDIVLQSTCFTSIMDRDMKGRIAEEMTRVLRDDGIILWHDFRYNNPQNPDVKGIGRKEIKELFPNCYYDFNLITLIPLISRKLASFSWFLCNILSRVPFMNTHYLVIIKKK